MSQEMIFWTIFQHLTNLGYTTTPQNQKVPVWSAFAKWRLLYENPISIIGGKSYDDCFWYSSDIIFIDCLNGQRTINTVYYCKLLRNIEAAWRLKWQFQFVMCYCFITMRNLLGLHKLSKTLESFRIVAL